MVFKIGSEAEMDYVGVGLGLVNKSDPLKGRIAEEDTGSEQAHHRYSINNGIVTEMKPTNQ